MKTIENHDVSPTEMADDERREKVIMNSTAVFKDNVSKMMGLVFDIPGESVDFEISMIIALHNFDLDNADSPYSEALKASFHYHMYSDPWELHERIEELSIVVNCVQKSGDDHNVDTIAKAALAVHKNRIVSKNFAKMDVDYFWEANSTTSIPSDVKQPD